MQLQKYMNSNNSCMDLNHSQTIILKFNMQY